MPTLPDHLAPEASAYATLSHSRSMGGGIPFSEIAAYCAFYRVADSERLIELIYKVDTGAHDGPEKKNPRRN